MQEENCGVHCGRRHCLHCAQHCAAVSAWHINMHAHVQRGGVCCPTAKHTSVACTQPSLPACRTSAAATALSPPLLTVMSHIRASAAWWAVWYGSPGSTSTLASAYDMWISSRMLLATRKAASRPSMPGLDTTPAAS